MSIFKGDSVCVVAVIHISQNTQLLAGLVEKGLIVNAPICHLSFASAALETLTQARFVGSKIPLCQVAVDLMQPARDYYYLQDRFAIDMPFAAFTREGEYVYEGLCRLEDAIRERCAPKAWEFVIRNTLYFGHVGELRDLFGPTRISGSRPLVPRLDFTSSDECLLVASAELGTMILLESARDFVMPGRRFYGHPWQEIESYIRSLITSRPFNAPTVKERITIVLNRLFSVIDGKRDSDDYILRLAKHWSDSNFFAFFPELHQRLVKRESRDIFFEKYAGSFLCHADR